MEALENELIAWFENNPAVSLDQAGPIFKQWCEAFPPVFGELKWTPSGFSYDRSLIKRVPPFFDILGLKWAPGAKAPYHDHAPRGCLQVVINGHLQERRLGTPPSTGEEARTLTPKDSPAFMHNSLGVHSISNPTDAPVFSLHLYSPCEYQTTFYD